MTDYRQCPFVVFLCSREDIHTCYINIVSDNHIGTAITDNNNSVYSKSMDIALTGTLHK